MEVKYFDIASLNSPYICGGNVSFEFASFIVFSPWNHNACNSMKVAKQILTKEQVIESLPIHKTVWKVFKFMYFTTPVNLIFHLFLLTIF